MGRRHVREAPLEESGRTMRLFEVLGPKIGFKLGLLLCLAVTLV